MPKPRARTNPEDDDGIPIRRYTRKRSGFWTPVRINALGGAGILLVLVVAAILLNRGAPLGRRGGSNRSTSATVVSANERGTVFPVGSSARFRDWRTCSGICVR